MKTLLSLVGLLACLLPTVAGAQSLTVPLTPPNWTVAVNQKVIIGGVSYNVTGTLTVAPTPTTGSLPNGTIGPMIGSFTPSLGALLVSGNGFGPAPGLVALDGDPAPILSWTDAAIKIDVSGVTGRRSLVLVRTAGGDYYQTSYPKP